MLASPLIGALRRRYPDAHIGWLVQAECAPLLLHHPDLDEVIVWPYREWRALLRERRLGELWRRFRAFRRKLRSRGFHLAIDLQGLAKSGVLTHASGAPERIGLGSREGSQWLMTRVVPRGGEPKRIGSEYLFLAETLGLSTADGFPMAVHYTSEERSFADGVIARERLSDGYAVISPFTTRPQKHWFEDRWAELTHRLSAELGLPVVLLGGPADVAAAARIRAQGTDRLTDLTGRTSLLQAAALIDRSALHIAVDTGLGHMGIAFGTPSLLLFGSTCPYRDTTRANARVLYHELPCSPCKRRPTCAGDFTCMRLIEVDEVIAAAHEVIGGAP